MKKYIIALDQGTTSSRAILFDHEGKIYGLAQSDFPQYFPRPGWVEHDPKEILSSQLKVLTELLVSRGISIDEVDSIGITNQRETTIVWDRHTGEPVYNALVWQCRRTTEIIDELCSDAEIRSEIIARTGLIPDAYYSASKIAWILRTVPGARDRALAGDLMFGTVDSWLIWQLTNHAVYATDPTNASRTMLFNIHEGTWDPWLCNLFDIPINMLPEVRPSSGNFGIMKHPVIAGEIPICGVAGDQQAALFGQCCFEPGEVKSTFGTGCFLLMHTGRKAPTSSHGLVTTVAASAYGQDEREELMGGQADAQAGNQTGLQVGNQAGTQADAQADLQVVESQANLQVGEQARPQTSEYHEQKSASPKTSHAPSPSTSHLQPPLEYALEGSVFMAGALLQWLKEGLHIIDDVAKTDEIAHRVDNNAGVVVVPAFTGLGAPYWDSEARGAIYGLTRGATSDHIVRACLEASGYQVSDVLRGMEADSNLKVKHLNVDGGACRNNFMLEFCSDILNVEIYRPNNVETTAMGAAFLSGLATGFWKSKDELRSLHSFERVFSPTMQKETRMQLLEQWHNAIARTLSNTLQ